MYEHIALLGLFALAYCVVAHRLEQTPINGPVVYLAFGVIAGPVVLGILDLELDGEAIRLIAELTLSLVLFHDAASADLSVLRRTLRLPSRMLLVGLPLTIVLGIGTGMLLFPELALLEIAILATMLAPTDAALGKAVVTNEQVPATLREGLNVESGLNDGICVPILFTFLALAAPGGSEESTGALALGLVAEEIGIGAGVGIGLAIASARALRAAAERGWIVEPWRSISIPALGFATFALAQTAGGSGFIACFTGGLVFGAVAGPKKEELLESAEVMGEAMSMLTWVVFGGVVAFQHGVAYDWRVVVYAVLSLTVVRMLPVAMSVLGLGVRTPSKLFLGWFGPRGLASVVFLVIVLQSELPGNDTILATTVVTVFLSILAHGLSANPLSARIGGHTS